ncbi:guanine nucleotide-binding protein subunit alpha [Microbotryomycetes sp. JL221]|nr:guanine nucleotide-binding protein subunit alpha [Microbotryomycetes sp. JL221]
MGCVQSSSSSSDHQESQRTKDIDKTLSRDREIINYRDTYTPAERLSYREVIYTNAIQSMQAVIKAFETLSIKLDSNELVQISQQILQVDQDSDQSGRINPELIQGIWTLWNNETTKQVVNQSNRFQLNDSAAYFFDNIQRIGSIDYVPSNQDILRTRIRTTGIIEEKFQLKNGMTLAVFDVGGQRSERKKWIHCFENVQVIVFVAAINEYDQFLWEDETVSRMSETMMLFESIATSRWFEKSTFVLLLNKTDLFVNKIESNISPLSNYFTDYSTTLDGDVIEAKQFILKKFLSLTNSDGKRKVPIYTHFSCATDTDQVRVVMAAVLDTVLANVLNEVGFL